MGIFLRLCQRAHARENRRALLPLKVRGASAGFPTGKPKRNESTMTAVGFEPTPLRTGAWSQRLRPLGQTVMWHHVCRAIFFLVVHTVAVVRQWVFTQGFLGYPTIVPKFISHALR